jgi:hypothetical protein
MKFPADTTTYKAWCDKLIEADSDQQTLLRALK